MASLLLRRSLSVDPCCLSPGTATALTSHMQCTGFHCIGVLYWTNALQCTALHWLSYISIYCGLSPGTATALTSYTMCIIYNVYHKHCTSFLQTATALTSYVQFIARHCTIFTTAVHCAEINHTAPIFSGLHCRRHQSMN